MFELLWIALLAAFAGFYAILSKHRQLRLKYGLNWWSALGIVLSAAVLGATYLGGVLLQPNRRNALFRLSTRFGTVVGDAVLFGLLQILAVVVILAIGGWLLFASRPSVRSDEALRTVLRTLYSRGEYVTLVEVIKDNYNRLIGHPSAPSEPRRAPITRPDEPLPGDVQQQIDQLTGLSETDPPAELPTETGHTSEDDETQDEPTLRERAVEAKARIIERIGAGVDAVRFHISKVRYCVAMWRYRRTTTPRSAKYINSIMIDPAFTEEHPILAPELGIRILGDDSLEEFPQARFIESYLSTLIASENSLLYQELRDNTSLLSDDHSKYYLNPENELLTAMFGDCQVAKQWAVYRPIGERTIDLLSKQGRKSNDRYCERTLSQDEHAGSFELTDPIFVAIRFFDIMVPEAFSQGFSWHMWLFYYKHFVDSICENYEVKPQSDSDDEWVNDYSYFLETMISNMIDWLRIMAEAVEDETFARDSTGCVAAEGPDLDSEATDPFHEFADFVRIDSFDTQGGGNIPKSTITCLIQCHKTILTTDQISERFKNKLTQMIFLRGLYLYQYGADSLQRRYAKFLLHRLHEEIDGPYHSEEYEQALRAVYVSDGPERGVRSEITTNDSERTGYVNEVDDAIGYSPPVRTGSVKTDNKVDSEEDSSR